MNDFYCSILVLETSATDILIDIAVFCFWLLKMKTVDSTKLNEMFVLPYYYVSVLFEIFFLS